MNPHSRYEISLYRIPGVVIMAVIALAIAAIAGSIYLASTTPGRIVPPLPHIHIHVTKPDVTGAIQRKLDAHNPLLQSMREVH